MTDAPFVTFPESMCAGEIIFSIDRVVGRTASSYTLQDSVYKWPGERWRADVTLPPTTDKTKAGEWKAFGVKLQGSFGTFLMGDASAKQPRGVVSGVITVDGAGQTGNQLNATGFLSLTDFVFRAGDYIQLGSGQSSRLHMVVDDVDSDSSGDATLNIEPALRESPTNGATITYINARGVFRLSSNSYSWRVSPGPTYRMSFQAEEVI